MAWTDEQKEQAKAEYLAANPTAETSAEIIKQIAEDMEQSPNGVRLILVQAGVYVKKSEATKPAGKTTGKKDGEAPKRVSKDDQIAELRTAIEAKGAEIDDEILNKLTGKAAAYFSKVLAA
jgi:hypothetical protein